MRPSNMSRSWSTKPLKPTVNHYWQHDAHYQAWIYTKIVVKRMDAPVADSAYMATMGDYDLDCKVGYGPTPEEAVEDLKIAMEE